MPRKKTRRGRRSLLSQLTIDQIRAELSRRHDGLLARRVAIESELNALNAEIAQFGDGATPPRRRRRGRPRGTGRTTGQRLGPGGKGRGRGGNEKSLPAL